MKEKFVIKNMHCTSCAKLIESAVMDMDGVSKASVSYQNENAEIEYDPSKTNKEAIIKTIKDLGYEASKAATGDSRKREGRGGLFNKLFGRK